MRDRRCTTMIRRMMLLVWRKALVVVFVLVALAAGGVPLVSAHSMSAKVTSHPRQYNVPLAQAAVAGAHVPDSHFNALDSSPYDTGQCSYGNPGIAYFATPVNLTYVGWIGCDAAHRLNIATTSDGSQLNNKVTLQNNYPGGVTPRKDGGPALAVLNGKLYVEFVGTNNNLYIGWFNSSTTLQNVVKLSETAIAAPALAFFVGTGSPTLYLIWTGTDTQHHLNSKTYDGTSFGATVENGNTAVAGPGATEFCGGGSCALWVAWGGTNSTNSPNVGILGGSGISNKHTFSSEQANGDVSLGTRGPAPLFVGWNADYTAHGIIAHASSSDGSNWGATGYPVQCQLTTSCTDYGAALAPAGSHMIEVWEGANGGQGDIYTSQIS